MSAGSRGRAGPACPPSSQPRTRRAATRHNCLFDCVRAKQRPMVRIPVRSAFPRQLPLPTLMHPLFRSALCATALVALTPAAPASAAPSAAAVPGLTAGGGAIAKAPDGTMWLAQPADPGKVTRIEPGGALHTYIGGVTENFPEDRSPSGMAITPDGRAWLLIDGLLDDWISITPSSGAVRRHELAFEQPTGIVAGPDGKLWMTTAPDHPAYSAALVSFDPATGNAVGYSSAFSSNSGLRGLTVGGDGALWFVEGSSGRVGRLTTGGNLSLTSVSPAPTLLGAGAGNAMWFAAPGTLGKLGSSGSAVATSANALALGPDGAIWSATTGGVFRTTGDGAIATHTAGVPADAVGKGIAAGPDGHMWMTLDRAPFLVRITVPPKLSGLAAYATAATTAEVTAEITPNGIPTVARLLLRGDDDEWTSLGETAVGDGTASQTVRFDVTGLAAGARNTLKLVAVNDAGAPSQSFVIDTEAGVTVPEPGVIIPEPTTPEPEPERPEPEPEPEPTTSEPAPEPTTLPDAAGPDPRPQPSTPAPEAPAAPRDAAPAAVPVPVQGTTMVFEPERGTVRYRVPGAKEFSELTSVASMPTGTVVDTTQGALQLASQVGDKTQYGTFSGGEIRVRQHRKTGLTQVVLVGELDCSADATRAAAKKKGKKRRHVWGKDRNGRFETHGRDSVATVRGTRWLTTDTCSSTVVKVYEGAVSVKPKRKGSKAVLVKAGGRHLTRKAR